MTVTVLLWRFATILDYVIEIRNNGKLKKFIYEFGNNKKISYYNKISLGYMVM